MVGSAARLTLRTPVGKGLCSVGAEVGGTISGVVVVGEFVVGGGVVTSGASDEGTAVVTRVGSAGADVHDNKTEEMSTITASRRIDDFIQTS